MNSDIAPANAANPKTPDELTQFLKSKIDEVNAEKIEVYKLNAKLTMLRRQLVINLLTMRLVTFLNLAVAVWYISKG